MFDSFLQVFSIFLMTDTQNSESKIDFLVVDDQELMLRTGIPGRP